MPPPPIAHSLGWPDYVIFFVILLFTYAVVIYGRSRQTPTERTIIDILLDGRRLTLPFFVATLVATWYGGILGVTEISYNHGIFNFVTQGVFWYASYLIFAFWIIPKLKGHSYVTLPEVVKKYFGTKAEKIAAIFNIFNVIPTTYALSIGLFLDALFQTGVINGTIIGVVIIIGYSFIGGFRSIVLSDIVQFSVMVTAVMCVWIFSIITYGGLNFLQENLPESHFTITGGHSISALLVWGFIALSTLVDPNFYHRAFAAKEPKVAQKGILVSTLIWMVFDLATTAGAMYAAATLANANIHSSQAYLYYGVELLPVGVKGFFLAGIFATILSTIDSYLFMASSTMSYDVIGNKKHRFLNSYRIHFILFALLAIVLAWLFSEESPFQSPGTIKNVWKTFGSYSAGCLLLPMLAAYAGFTKRGFTAGYFITSTTLSAVVISLWRLTSKELKEPYLERISSDLKPLASLDDLYMGLLTSLIVIAISWLHWREAKTKTLGKLYRFLKLIFSRQ